MIGTCLNNVVVIWRNGFGQLAQIPNTQIAAQAPAIVVSGHVAVLTMDLSTVGSLGFLQGRSNFVVVLRSPAKPKHLETSLAGLITKRNARSRSRSDRILRALQNEPGGLVLTKYSAGTYIVHVPTPCAQSQLVSSAASQRIFANTTLTNTWGVS